MRVKRVPLFLCLKALEHFSVAFREGRHGYVEVEERAIDFFKAAIDCKECKVLMEEIDIENALA